MVIWFANRFLSGREGTQRLGSLLVLSISYSASLEVPDRVYSRRSLLARAAAARMALFEGERIEAREVFLTFGTVEAAVKAAGVGTKGAPIGAVAEGLADNGRADDAVEVLLIAGEVEMAVDILRARGRGAEAAVLAREWGRALAVREIARAVGAEKALKGVAAVLLAAVGEVGEVAALFADADEREQADFIRAGARG
jgi:hypothetical protein